MPRDTSNGRDPNWSEPETAMLICLANHYITVLGSTSNDAKTIKLKQQIWEDIETKMAQCNYKRCKERLRQKWQRLRAAMAKKERLTLVSNESVAETACKVENVSINVDTTCKVDEQSTRLKQKPQSMETPIKVLPTALTEARKRSSVNKVTKPAKTRGRAKRGKLNEMPKNLEPEFA